MGHFTLEILEKFQAMCMEGMDFGEGPVYDFAMCLTSSGKVYGVSSGEACKVGKPISDEQGKALKNKNKEKDPATRMAILKKAFLKKTGREMNREELAKAARMVD